LVAKKTDVRELRREGNYHGERVTHLLRLIPKADRLSECAVNFSEATLSDELLEVDLLHYHVPLLVDAVFQCLLKVVALVVN